MQAHKNSTPLGIHTRRRVSRRVASMRCSATAFKKGKQKLHHRAPVSLRLGFSLKSTCGCSALSQTALRRIICDGTHCVRSHISERGNRASSKIKNRTACSPSLCDVFMLWSSNTGKWHGCTLVHWKSTKGIMKSQLLLQNAEIVCSLQRYSLITYIYLIKDIIFILFLFLILKM